MPTETFRRLKTTKKEALLEAIYRELSIHDFEHINLSNIISESQISRGSFYQYFEDKKDMYDYVLNQIAENKKSYLVGAYTEPNIAFFERVNLLIKLGLKFKNENPILFKIGKKLFKDPYFYEQQVVKGRVQSLIDTYQTWIEIDQANGLIDPNTDSLLLAEVVNDLVTKLSTDSFIYDKYPEAIWEHKIDELLKMLKKGVICSK